MSEEPRLSAQDRAVWDRWLILAKRHSRTREFQRNVDLARRITMTCLEQIQNPAIMWSGGKDSTCMAHLILAEAPSVVLVSEKDDLDYPGELDYVQGLAKAWGATLEVVTPEVSPAEWITQHSKELGPSDDLHSRAAELSKACFYGIMEEANQDRGAIFLGLRQQESKARALNRASRGPIYSRREGQLTCTPIVDWSGIDVYAYAVSRDIELLNVYQCVAFLHSQEPWRIRKSWWIPGSHSRNGGVAWLRHYWPSLYQRLREWIPRAQSLT